MLQYQLLASLRSAFLCAETRKHYPEIIGHEVGMKSQIVRNCKRNTRRLQPLSAHASVLLFLVAESGYQIKYRKSAEYCRKQKQKGLCAGIPPGQTHRNYRKHEQYGQTRKRQRL